MKTNLKTQNSTIPPFEQLGYDFILISREWVAAILMTFPLVSKTTNLFVIIRTMIDDDFESANEMEESSSDNDEMELEVLFSLQISYI